MADNTNSPLAIRAQIGTLASLTTTDMTSVVSAINEVQATATAIKSTSDLDSITVEGADASKRYMVSDLDNSVFQYIGEWDYATYQYTLVDRYGLDYLTPDGLLFRRTVHSYVTPFMFGAQPRSVSDTDQSDAFDRMIQLAANDSICEQYNLTFYVPCGEWRVERTVDLFDLAASWVMDGVFWAPNTVTPFPIVMIKGYPANPYTDVEAANSLVVAVQRQFASGTQPVWKTDTTLNGSWKSFRVASIVETGTPGVYTATVALDDSLFQINHGMQSGSVVEFEELVGGTSTFFNRKEYAISNVTATTFDFSATTGKTGHTANSGWVTADRRAWLQHNDVGVEIINAYPLHVDVKETANCAIGVKWIADKGIRTLNLSGAPSGGNWVVGDVITNGSGQTMTICKVFSQTEFRVRNYKSAYTIATTWTSGTGYAATGTTVDASPSASSQASKLQINNFRTSRASLVMGSIIDDTDIWVGANDITFGSIRGASSENVKHRAAYRVMLTGCGDSTLHTVNTNTFHGGIHDTYKQPTIGIGITSIIYNSGTTYDVVTDSAHELAVGDVIRFWALGTGLTSLNNGSYLVTAAPTTTTFSFDHSTPSLSGTASAGSCVANWQGASILLDRAFSNFWQGPVRVEDNFGSAMYHPVLIPNNCYVNGAIDNHIDVIRTTSVGPIVHNQKNNPVQIREFRQTRLDESPKLITELTPESFYWGGEDRCYVKGPWSRKLYNNSAYAKYTYTNGGFGQDSNGLPPQFFPSTYLFDDSSRRQRLIMWLDVWNIQPWNYIASDAVLAKGDLMIGAQDSSGNFYDIANTRYVGNHSTSGLTRDALDTSHPLAYMGGTSREYSFTLNDRLDISKVCLVIASQASNIESVHKIFGYGFDWALSTSVTISSVARDLKHTLPGMYPMNAVPERGYWREGQRIQVTGSGEKVCTTEGAAVVGDWASTTSVTKRDWIFASGTGRVYQVNTTGTSGTVEPSHTAGTVDTNGDGIEYTYIGASAKAVFA